MIQVVADWILAVSRITMRIHEFVKDFFYRATLCVSAVFAVARCPSVCPSVCLSRSCILSTRLKISSNFFVGPVAPSC